VPADDGLKLAGCRWYFSDDPLEPRGFREYPTLILGEEWFSIDRALVALEEVVTQQRRLGPALLSYDEDRMSLQQQLKVRIPSLSGWTEDRVTIPVVRPEAP